VWGGFDIDWIVCRISLYVEATDMKRLMLILLLILVPMVSAENVSTQISSFCDEVQPYDYESIMECEIGTYSSSASTLMKNRIDGLSGQIMNATKGDTFNQAKAQDFYEFFRGLFAGLLVLIIIITSYRFMLSSGDPIKREQCKRTFMFLLFAGVMIAALPFLINEVNHLSGAVISATMAKTDLGNDDPFKLDQFIGPEVSDIDASVQTLSKYYNNIPVFAGSATAYIISSTARNLLLTALIALSPMILLMFVSDSARELGKLLLALLILEFFIPVFNLIVLDLATTLSGTDDLIVLAGAMVLAVVFHAILIIAVIFRSTVKMTYRQVVSA
jgi:predicted PurR-regulated permease PerM